MDTVTSRTSGGRSNAASRMRASRASAFTTFAMHMPPRYDGMASTGRQTALRMTLAASLHFAGLPSETLESKEGDLVRLLILPWEGA